MTALIVLLMVTTILALAIYAYKSARTKLCTTACITALLLCSGYAHYAILAMGGVHLI